MARAAFQSGMRAGQREAGLPIMIEAPKGPTVRVMATVASRSPASTDGTNPCGSPSMPLTPRDRHWCDGTLHMARTREVRSRENL